MNPGASQIPKAMLPISNLFTLLNQSQNTLINLNFNRINLKGKIKAKASLWSLTVETHLKESQKRKEGLVIGIRFSMSRIFMKEGRNRLRLIWCCVRLLLLRMNISFWNFWRTWLRFWEIILRTLWLFVLYHCMQVKSLLKFEWLDRSKIWGKVLMMPSGSLSSSVVNLLALIWFSLLRIRLFPWLSLKYSFSSSLREKCMN